MSDVEHRAIVFGATGYTGRCVVEQLVAAGVATTAHVRPDSSRAEFWQTHFSERGATVHQAAWTLEGISEAYSAIGPTVVFLLLGTTRARAAADAKAGRDSSYEAVDYGLTALAIDAGSASLGEDEPKFVYLSSMGVGEAEPREGSYLHARWRVEQRLSRLTSPWVAARPSIITGPDRDETRLGERMAGVALNGMLSVVGLLGGNRIRQRYRSTTNERLAGALVRLGLDDEAKGVFESDALQ